MGYSTDFDGTIEFSRPLTVAEAKTLTDHAEQRHGGNMDVDPGAPGFWCNFVANENATGLVWNGNEKTYDAEAWIQLICDKFLKPWGVVANGELRAQGEDPSDAWLLRVTDNKVTRVNGRLVFEEA